MKSIFVVLFCLFSIVAFSQEGSREERPQNGSEQEAKPPITDYKIISVSNDTTVVDTSLHILKDYRFNYLRRDNFGLLPFSNVGQTYNHLVYDFRRIDKDLTPDFGARARHFAFKEVEDIFHYNVPTPFTELFFKTVYEQGQILESLFTVNTSKNFNFSVGYKGLRSLGKYQHILTSNGNFQATINYNTTNKRYQVKTHFVSQDLLNQENGGLSPLALEQYLSNGDDYQDRSRLNVNFEDAENVLYGKRFYLNQSFALTPPNSSGSSSFSVGHVLNFNHKKFIFRKATASEILGPSFETTDIRDEVKLENIYNEINVGWMDQGFGNLKARVWLANFNYGYNSVLELEEGRIDNRLIGETYSLGGEYLKQIGQLEIYLEASVGVSGDYTGSNYEGRLNYSFRSQNEISMVYRRTEEAANFNFLLHQSDFINYNWQNDFDKVNTNVFSLAVEFPALLGVEAEYINISDYAYFGADAEGFVRPFQYSGAINYLKVKGQREFRLGKFALNNTVLYQKVTEGDAVFKVPSLVTRNTLYFQDYWFKRALFLQTGLTLNYFTDYYMNSYDPVLAEFYVQNSVEFEGFPTVDFFFNGKIRQARIFFKLEHLNALLMGNDNFSAPLYPYRDFGVRFGLVWNFFM